MPNTKIVNKIFDMKRIVILLASLLASYTMMLAQNFNAEDGKIYWQKVYEKEIDIVSALTNAGIFTDITTTNGVVSARMKQTAIDLNGRSTMSVPILIRDGNMTCFVRIQSKEGRYRVTVEQFKIHNKYEENNEVGTELEFWYIKKQDSSLKPAFNKTAAPVLDDMLSDLFAFNDKLDDEW